MLSSTLVAGISLATMASAAPLFGGLFDAFTGSSNQGSPSSTGTCKSARVPISVQVDTTAISMSKPSNQGDLTGFLAEYWSTGSTVASQIMSATADGTTQKKRVQGTYNIWAQTCQPNGKQGQVPLIIGIHGINFDHSYWEFGYSKEYNFIEAANTAGYAVLTYDRLGVGQSDKPDGLNVVQSSTEVEILHQFIQQARASGKYSKVLGIGHSYGSIQLTGIAAKYPSDLDAVILTGFAPSMVTVPLAFTAWSQTLGNQQPDMATRARWASLPSGSAAMNDQSYMGTGSASSDRFAFFAKGAYDEDAFKLAYNTKQTHTLGEFLTIGEPISKPATDYKGHVLVVTGEKDIIFCGGNCLQKPTQASGDNLLYDTKVLYPSAASFSANVPSGAGHALFAHRGTNNAIKDILTWCKNTGF